MTDAPLTVRALNRARLARQLLLERERVDVTDAVRRVGGLQAQEPRPPFAALWSRLEGFEPGDLIAPLAAGELVRATAMRATLHVLRRDDLAALRPALDPVMDAAMRGALKGRMEHLDLDAVLPAARELLRAGPRTFDELRDALAERFPKANERALGYAVRTQLDLVVVPSDDRWGFPRPPRFTLAGGRRRRADPAAVVLHHLAAFGPATAADVQTWSGLGGLKDVVEGLQGRLVALHDERGRELFDLPDAPRPDEDVAAPPRLLAPFDSLVLAHKDRSRIVAEEHRPRMASKNLRVPAVALVDGMAAGIWTTERKGKRATLRIAPFARLRKADRTALEAEAEGMLALLEGDAASRSVVYD